MLSFFEQAVRVSINTIGKISVMFFLSSDLGDTVQLLGLSLSYEDVSAGHYFKGKKAWISLDYQRGTGRVPGDPADRQRHVPGLYPAYFGVAYHQ